jgi:hypothetical protein
VFIGHVTDTVEERAGGSIYWTVHKIAVGQVLRGSVDSFVTLVPLIRPSADQIAASQSKPPVHRASSGDYRFELGRHYLIYALRTPEGSWTTTSCAGTKPLEEAGADLAYIRAVPPSGSTGRVYGSIERTVLDRRTGRKRSEPASGLAVSLVSEAGTLTTTTSARGTIDVNVPAGAYLVKPAVPDTVRVYGTLSRTIVPARGCAPVHFSFIENGGIAGRLSREDGGQVANTWVTVIPIELTITSPEDMRHASLPSDVTDENGRFEIDPIPPGRYHLAVNATWGPKLDSPYVPVYFPAVSNRAEAHVIDVGDGERKSGLQMVVTPLAETTLSGVVTSGDGRPVEDAIVYVKPHIGGGTRSDATGAFRLRVLNGLTYTVGASIPTPNGRRPVEATVSVDGPTEGVILSLQVRNP